MNWHRLRTGFLGLVLVWSALFPFAAEAMARVSNDESWLLCAPQVRGELSDEDSANLAILAELSDQSAADDVGAPTPACDDCLACPPAALPIAALANMASPDHPARTQDRQTGLVAAPHQPGQRPDARAPPWPYGRSA